MCHYGTVGCPDQSDAEHTCRTASPATDPAWAAHMAAVNAAALATACENCGAAAGAPCEAGCNGARSTPAAEAPRRFCPIYEKDGHRLIVTHEEFVGATRDEAFMIALGSQLLETILLGLHYTGEILDLPEEGTPHVPAKLGPYNVAIVGGPVWDEHAPAAAKAQNGTTGGRASTGGDWTPASAALPAGTPAGATAAGEPAPEAAGVGGCDA